jgi:hypothetical protein
MPDLTELRDEAQRGINKLFPAGLLTWREHEPETVWRISTITVGEIDEKQTHIILHLALADVQHAVITLHLTDFLPVKSHPPIAKGISDGEAWILAQFPVRVN